MKDEQYETLSRIIEVSDGQRWDCQFASALQSPGSEVRFSCRPEEIPQAEPIYIELPTALAINDAEVAKRIAAIQRKRRPYGDD